MLGTVGAALLAIPEAVALGIAAMGFEAAAFRRVAGDGAARGLVVLVVYFAGMSLAVGNGVVLLLNRVRPWRFLLSLALMGAIHLIGALVTTATAILAADLVGRDLDFVPTLAVIALAQAPRLLGFLTFAPYFGELFDRLLDVWVLLLVLYGLHQALGMTVQGAAVLALLGWAATRVLTLVFGRPLTRVVGALSRAAAGQPLTLDSRNLVETLRADSSDAGRNDER